MAFGGSNLEQKQAWMREARSGLTGAAGIGNIPAFAQTHYTVAEIATMWHLSHDLVRTIFQEEPGVIVINEKVSTGRKRAYTILRIPESVAERVYRRLSNTAIR